MPTESYRYIIGNSPKLPHIQNLPTEDALLIPHVKIQYELLQEDIIAIIITDVLLTPIQLSKIEYAILNPAR